MHYGDTQTSGATAAEPSQVSGAVIFANCVGRNAAKSNFALDVQ